MGALPPGSTIGVLGGGQLGRMLILAAARLGLKCHVYTDVYGPACDVAAAWTIGAYDDLAKVEEFTKSVDVVTYEFENVPVATAEAAQRIKPVRPGPRSLEVSQDRLTEKRFVAGLGIPVAPFASVDSVADLESAIGEIGLPAILKTRRLGYDGKGQVRIQDASEAAAAIDAIAGAPALLEGFVRFDCEVSVIAVRSQDGETRCYDVPTNGHKDGILRRSTVPSALPAAHLARAQKIAETIAGALDHIGVLSVEMFHVPGSETEPLIVNEMAPRVHNTGHWTIDACPVSQFENHIRAIAGWPLGTAGRHSDAEMDNLIGDEVEPWRDLAAQEGLCVHIYGKGEARPGRKMGHITRIFPKSTA